MLPTTNLIAADVDGAILTLRINRPEAMNSLNPQAHEELHQLFNAYAADDALRVAIITGAGDRAFCAGTDLKDRATTTRDVHPPTGFAGLTRRFDLDKPVIAAINGAAVGGGMEIMLACDIAVATEHAWFSLPETRVGLAATGGAGLHRLVRQIPMKIAMGMILSGRRYTAQDALGFGLINEVVTKENLMPAARAWAQDIAKGAPLAVAASKQVAMRNLDYADLADALAADYPAVEVMLDSEDAREGPRAFAEKRKPQWKGR